MRGDLLPVAEMTGFVISDLLICAGRRLFDSDLRQPLVNVFNFVVPLDGARDVRRIVREQRFVMF